MMSINQACLDEGSSFIAEKSEAVKEDAPIQVLVDPVQAQLETAVNRFFSGSNEVPLRLVSKKIDLAIKERIQRVFPDYDAAAARASATSDWLIRAFLAQFVVVIASALTMVISGGFLQTDGSIAQTIHTLLYGITLGTLIALILTILIILTREVVVDRRFSAVSKIIKEEIATSACRVYALTDQAAYEFHIVDGKLGKTRLPLDELCLEVSPNGDRKLRSGDNSIVIYGIENPFDFIASASSRTSNGMEIGQ